MNKKDIKAILLRIVAAGGLYGLYVALSALCHLAMRTSMFLRYGGIGDFWNEQRFHIAASLYSWLVLFSLFSIFALYDASYKTHFYSVRRPDWRFGDKCKFVITSKEFLIQMGVIFGIILLFPSRPAYNSLISGFFHGNGFVPSPVIERLLVFAIVLPLQFVIGFVAHLSTVNWWMRKKQEEDLLFHPVRALRQFIFSTVLYIVTASVLVLVFPAVFVNLYTIFKAFFWIWIAVFAVLFIGFWALIIGRILYKRRRFVAGLHSICKSSGFRLTEHHKPYETILSAKDGVDFTVEARGQTFSCKLIPSLSRKNNLFFHDDGYVFYTSSMMDIIFHTVAQPYFFEGDGKKIIIVNPVSNRLYITNDHENRLLEIGDTVHDYAIYTATGFLNALRRGCL